MADICQYVIGVDTHAATHHYAVIHPGTGAVLDDQQFPTTPAGLRRAADWISRRTVTINMLTALLHANALDMDAGHALTITQLGQVATWRPRTNPWT